MSIIVPGVLSQEEQGLQAARSASTTTDNAKPSELTDAVDDNDTTRVLKVKKTKAPKTTKAPGQTKAPGEKGKNDYSISLFSQY